MAVVLGVGGAFHHDPSAALLIDGKLIAAVDEERFIRKKHAIREKPVHSIRFCLEKAGIRPEQVEHVAFPWSPESFARHRWKYIRRIAFTQHARAFKALVRPGREFEKRKKILYQTLDAVGISPQKVKIHWVDHHLSHGASAFLLSGFPKAAVLSIDGGGELTSCFFGEGEGNQIKTVHEIILPDSLGLFYSTFTEFCGFRSNNGEFKLMGMSAYGDASKFDISPFIQWDRKGFRCNEKYIWVFGRRRYKDKVFSKELVELLGPPRQGDGLSEPYIHIAAAVQKVLEDITIGLVEEYLGDALDRLDNRLCFAGGCALNVVLNKKLIQHPKIKELWVQPGANDSGAPLGAAVWIASQLGDTIQPMQHAYYGPSFTNDEIQKSLDQFKIPYQKLENPAQTGAKLLSEGKILAWFQGAMEFGPRALGNRSILAHPAIPGISDEINGRIKFREKWRPFCPSILDSHSSEILGSDHPSPFMTFSFDVNEEWKKKIPEVVHVNGTARPQIVSKELNPLYYQLLKEFYSLTDLPCVINTSLNRRGEPIICTPEDSIAMFYGSGLEYMIMGDFLIKK
ncbi:MAG: carbamoyltransferase [Planctomycetota bacterium]|nr:MAG: carbamoyltransferase [Planctomycetota bacterium]